MEDAAGFIEALRVDGKPRQAISVSFRAAPELLSFVNDVFAAIVDGEVPTDQRPKGSIPVRRPGSFSAER